MAASSITSAGPWGLTRRQIGVAVALMVGIALVFASYVALNHAPPPSRWPGFYAWDPATGKLAQPLSGAGAYQTFLLESWLDQHVPFVPALAVPYLSFLVLIPVVIPLLSLRVSYRRFLTVAIALIVSQLVLDVSYLLFQSEVIRNVDAGDGVGGFLVRLVWGNDQPFNCFPSGHCTWTMVGICALMRLRTVMPRTAWVMSAWLSLVFPATVMLRQHYLIDVFAGVFVGFAVYWAVMFVVERPVLAPGGGDDLRTGAGGERTAVEQRSADAYAPGHG